MHKPIQTNNQTNKQTNTHTHTKFHSTAWLICRETLDHLTIDHHMETPLRLLLTGSFSSSSLFSWSSLCIRHDLWEDNRSCGSRPTVYFVSSLMQNVPWVPTGWKGFRWSQPPHCRNLVGNLPSIPSQPPQVKGVAGYEGVWGAAHQVGKLSRAGILSDDGGDDDAARLCFTSFTFAFLGRRGVVTELAANFEPVKAARAKQMCEL